MQGEPPTKASTPTGAVFLSYASQDAEAARRICDALRAAGIEVWFDQSELRGGDAWDQKIRRELHDCALFMPVISAHTAARHEGYFRLEWDIADRRTHMIARNRAFIVPVCVDATPETSADTPEAFHRVQWTRLPAGETPSAFVERVRHLLSGERSTPARAGAVSVTEPALGGRAPASGWSKRLLPAVVLVMLFGAVAYLAIERPWISKPAASAAFAPPPHSVAVVPFVNMSGDKEQEYFSDGLTEELLNSLAAITELQVAARTSAFSFKDKDTDLGTIARKLNVGTILEGSVRRSGNTVRITAQLINAVTGFHLWSKTYDRDLGDVLALQTEIATAVAGALKVALLGEVAAEVALGGTRNPAAFDAYLRGVKYQREGREAKDVQAEIDAFTDAVRLDPNYALAYAARSFAVNVYAGYWTSSVAAAHEGYEKAVADARKAILLAPELGDGHRSLAWAFANLLDFRHAIEEFDRAIALAPGNARVLRDYGIFAVLMGRTAAGLAASRHLVTLDPLNRDSHLTLGNALNYTRSYEAAIAAYNDALVLDSASSEAYALRGLAQYMLGDFKGATLSCEMKTSDFIYYLVCLAITYDKLGRHTDAETMLGKLKTRMGEADAYQYAEIYAQWGDKERALQWLETAWRLRDSGLGYLKADFLLDPLRKEPRFQAIERELKFPS